MISWRRIVTLGGSALFLLAAACSSTPPADPPATDDPAPVASDAPPVDAPSETQRPEMSAADCEAKGGTVVGDIGDGKIHRPEFRCPSGSPPIGRIALGVEGSVCCT